MTASNWTLLFLVVLALNLLTRFALALRHLHHVARHRDAVPPAFADSISLTAHQKAADYTRAKTRLSLLHIALDGLILLVLTLGGGLELLVQFSLGLVSHPILGGVVFIGITMTLLSLLELPLVWYQTFSIEARFGFNKMTPGLFIADHIKQWLLGLALGLPLLYLVLWFMHNAGALWWLYTWLAWVGFNLLILAIFPTFIAPLFNKFIPLEDDTLRQRIEGLLQKCGFKASGVFIMDGSRRSSHGNAYFTGLGKSKRIVFFDTLLKHLAPEEIEAVLAHELGHFKHHHIGKRMFWMFSLSLLLLWVLSLLMQQPWFYAGLGITTTGTAMALLLFFLVLPVFTFLLHPLTSYHSRKHEYEADSYAARQASASDLVAALIKLYRDNASTLTPDPWYSRFYDSHPPAPLRIAHLQAGGHNFPR